MNVVSLVAGEIFDFL